MADVSYPQLPTTVWRGVRQILKRTPKRKLDEAILAVELEVQQTAAKQYLRQFVILGLLGDDGTPTDLADRWRQDDEGAISEILSNAYPKPLLDLAPPENLDRAKIIRWFTGQGLGTGAAGNKAATYMMIAQAASGEDELTAAVPSPRRRAPSSNSNDRATPKARSAPPRAQENAKSRQDVASTRQGLPDLNVNVQIHISADASSEQIDAIFSSMKRYFDDAD